MKYLIFYLLLAGCATSPRLLYIPFPTIEGKEDWIKAHPDVKLVKDSANIIIIRDYEEK
jgi:hypothetical protein